MYRSKLRRRLVEGTAVRAMAEVMVLIGAGVNNDMVTTGILVLMKTGWRCYCDNSYAGEDPSC